jgi:molybdopterin biosynthesis enzyme MoaB
MVSHHRLFAVEEILSTMIRLGLLWIGLPVDEAWSAGLLRLLRELLPALALLQQAAPTPQRYVIEEILRTWADEEELDLILTLGGTFPAPGPSGLEIAPEATRSVLEREMPSLPETMRACALEESPEALLDRGVAGIRGRTLLINLPGDEALSLTFLASVYDVLGAIMARLRSQDAPVAAPLENGPDALNTATPAPSAGLDAAEFAAFRRSRGQVNFPKSQP